MAKAVKQKIPDIPWAENNNALNWAFLTELEKDANYKILFGKKDRTEVCLTCVFLSHVCT